MNEKLTVAADRRPCLVAVDDPVRPSAKQSATADIHLKKS
jgi:hypothetical protein